MLDVKSVLVVIDPNQEHQPALEKVLQLARGKEFNITLLACEYTQYLVEGYYFEPNELSGLREAFLQEQHEKLASLSKILTDAGLNVESVAVWGHPAHEVIISEAQARNVDLIVQPTRRHAAISRMFLSNDDWQMVRKCPIPLLLIKEKPWAAHPKLVVAVDPKHSRHKPGGLDHKLIANAEILASCLNGETHVVHAYGQIPLSGTFPESAKSDHKQAFDTLMSDFTIPADRQHFSEEVAVYGIDETAKQLSADIILMGAISRSRLKDVFVGNTTEKVLDFVEADVLVMKPES
jgi:universal stress protein E